MLKYVTNSMKKSSLIVAVCFSLMTLIASSSLYAVTETQEQTGVALIPEHQEIATPSVEYALPYPGILPDHPLYPLKKFRDRLLDFLIKDPVKRIEFNLLMSDKRYHMGIYLSDEQKYDRAYTIMEEAEYFYSRIADEIQAARDKNKTIPPDLLDNVKTAARKHREVTVSVKNKSPENMTEGFEKILVNIEDNIEKIDKISL